ncbi:hypothetical protein [Leptospira kmetyi]|uniref:Uncharacterized protein n=1 Tax=Leptospira kmetyi TaxID=408139 RepID=A0ABX4NDX8_9LEPT|nr:hypothetical protein [Leptospira kmetyi]PJZ31552.1 hypothetical protein CH378_01785 [Leptospira kmetyi]
MKNLYSELRSRLFTEDFSELIEALRDFKEGGGRKNLACAVLKELREDPELAKYEDRLLELMDLLDDFCLPHLRIWKIEESPD